MATRRNEGYVHLPGKGKHCKNIRYQTSSEMFRYSHLASEFIAVLSGENSYINLNAAWYNHAVRQINQLGNEEITMFECICKSSVRCITTVHRASVDDLEKEPF